MKNRWIVIIAVVALGTVVELRSTASSGPTPAEAREVTPRDRVFLTYDYFNLDRANEGVRLPVRGDVTSTSLIAASNTFCFFDLSTQRTSLPGSAFTPPLRGPMSLALYPVNTRQVAFIAPASSSSNRLLAVALAQARQPHDVLGELGPFPWGDQAGHSVAVGNFWGGPEPEIAVTTGAGPTTRVYVGAYGAANWMTFLPFDASYTGGATVTAGNLLGDGNPYDQLAVSQNQGGRVDVFVSTEEAIDRVIRGIGQGPDPRGPSVSIFDANDDGHGDFIFGHETGVTVVDIYGAPRPYVLAQFQPFPPGVAGEVHVTSGLTSGRFTIGAAKGTRLSTWVWNTQTHTFERTYDDSPFGPNSTPVTFQMHTDLNFVFSPQSASARK
jgi:hypothetical protein